MSHKHYCDAEGHEWQCTDSTCECVCDLLMEQGNHSECPIELRACPEHQDVQLPESADDELTPNYFKAAAHGAAQRPHCKCGCAAAHPEAIVGSCVWCSHVYDSYNTKIEAQHFSDFCPGAPAQLRDVAQQKLGRLN